MEKDITMAVEKCGCLAGGFVNRVPIDSTKRGMLKEWLNAGCTISTVPVEAFRAAPVHCAKHAESPAQEGVK